MKRSRSTRPRHCHRQRRTRPANASTSTPSTPHSVYLSKKGMNGETHLAVTPTPRARLACALETTWPQLGRLFRAGYGLTVNAEVKTEMSRNVIRTTDLGMILEWIRSTIECFLRVYFCFVASVARLDAPIITMSQTEVPRQNTSINNLRHVRAKQAPRYHCASYNSVYHPSRSTSKQIYPPWYSPRALPPMFQTPLEP
jgi:hypothetical protein